MKFIIFLLLDVLLSSGMYRVRSDKLAPLKMYNFSLPMHTITRPCVLMWILRVLICASSMLSFVAAVVVDVIVDWVVSLRVGAVNDSDDVLGVSDGVDAVVVVLVVSRMFCV
jgi:hypothetical protein